MLLSRFLDFLYPPRCELCQIRLRDGKSLCPDCAARLVRVQAPFCQDCGEPYDGHFTAAFSCQNCADLDFHFDFARAALVFQPEGRQLIHAVKYQRQFHLAPALADLLVEVFATDSRLRSILDHEEREKAPPLLIPVPLHWRREHQRTANQAFEIARGVSRSTGIPVLNALRRPHPTKSQARLRRVERMRNLASAFLLPKKHHHLLTGRTLFLIDDVFTTGATTNACARALRAAKPAKIVVLSVMRG